MNPLFFSVGAEGGPALQALAHNGLASHAQEWHREWQRAQARAWLHVTPERSVPSDLSGSFHDGAVENFGVGAAGPDAHAAVNHLAVQAMSPPPAVPTGSAAVASCASSTPQCYVASNELAAPDQPRPPEIASGWKLPTRQAAAERETVHRTPAGASEPRPEKGTFRLHVECADQGLRVWIGADGDAVAVSARAAAILAELRRSEHASSLPIASVVCNGRTLYASGNRAAFPPENPP